MLLKPKTVRTTEDFENKLIIEKWMKRNSSSRVTIGQNIVNPNELNKSSNVIPVVKTDSHKVALSVSKTKVMKVVPQIVTSAKVSNIIPKKSASKKRPCESDKIELSISKVLRQSLPTDSCELQKVNKNAPARIVSRKSAPPTTTKSKAVITKISCRVEPGKNSTNKPTAVTEETSAVPAVKSNVPKPTSSLISTLKTDVKNIATETSSRNNIKNILSKEKDADVYTSLLENYRYLITPKSWSVTEFMSEKKDRYIVFFNPHVIKENDTLISVTKKSLIIDKGSTMNYSVHGLPVDIKGTILPKTLDNTKKLLSILHIFDKMQVCDGLGNDLNIMQTDFVFKDSCRVWRHKHCKIVLIKATRCPICTETRALVLERRAICKKEPINSIEFVGVKEEMEE